MDLYECEPPTRCVNSPMNRCPTTRSTGSSTTQRLRPAAATGKEARITVVRDAQTRQRLAELGIPGARRYIAQQMAGD